MPFKSDKQRKWMHANDPEMAKKWEKEEDMKEGNIGITTKKGKTIELTHKTSGKEIVVTNTPSTLKKYKKLGFLISMPEGKLEEASAYKTASRNELAMYISQLSNTIKGTKDGKMLNLLKKTKKEVEKELKSRKTNEGKLEEKAKRDYKDEYKKFQSSTKSKKYRAELNKYNRKKGTYGNGDGKDASHKGGKIAGFEEQSKNRGRKEKRQCKTKL